MNKTTITQRGAATRTVSTKLKEQLSVCFKPDWRKKSTQHCFPRNLFHPTFFPSICKIFGGRRWREGKKVIFDTWLLSWNLQHTAIKTKLNELIFVKR